MMRLCFWALIVLLSVPGRGWAQSGSDMLQAAADSLMAGKPVQAYEFSMTAAGEIARSMPFALPKVVLTDAVTSGFAMEVPRQDNSYAAGEPVEVYIEPRGYGYRESGGRHQYGFSVDLTVTDPDGKILGGQTGIGSWQFDSRRPNLETFISLTIELTGIPEGDYILELRVHDLSIGDVSATAKLPIIITG